MAEGRSKRRRYIRPRDSWLVTGVALIALAALALVRDDTAIEVGVPIVTVAALIAFAYLHKRAKARAEADSPRGST